MKQRAKSILVFLLLIIHLRTYGIPILVKFELLCLDHLNNQISLESSENLFDAQKDSIRSIAAHIQAHFIAQEPYAITEIITVVNGTWAHLLNPPYCDQNLVGLGFPTYAPYLYIKAKKLSSE